VHASFRIIFVCIVLFVNNLSFAHIGLVYEVMGAAHSGRSLTSPSRRSVQVVDATGLQGCQYSAKLLNQRDTVAAPKLSGCRDGQSVDEGASQLSSPVMLGGERERKRKNIEKIDKCLKEK
jgi:hypothetical protein